MPEPMDTVGHWDTDLQITVVSLRFPGLEDRPLVLEFAGYDEAEAQQIADALLAGDFRVSVHRETKHKTKHLTPS